MHLFVGAGLATALFLGGWRGPGASDASVLGALLGFIYFLVKTVLIIFLMMWIRGTLPRFRIDHLLDFGWKFLVPTGLFGLMAVALVLKLPFLGSSVLKWLGLLIANVVVFIVALSAVSLAARHTRSVALRSVSGTER